MWGDRSVAEQELGDPRFEVLFQWGRCFRLGFYIKYVVVNVFFSFMLILFLIQERCNLF